MKPSRNYVKPVSGCAPSGRPENTRPEGDWTHHWTLGDCIKHFEWIPAAFWSLNLASTVAGVWFHLTMGDQSRLDQEFTFYDIRTGRI